MVCKCSKISKKEPLFLLIPYHFNNSKTKQFDGTSFYFILLGKNEWQLQDRDYDYHREVARAAFADMLHDSERVLIIYLNALI